MTVAKNGPRPHWRVLQEATRIREAMTVDQRLAFAQAADPAAHLMTCQHCKQTKVASLDTLRSDFARNASAYGVNGFAPDCKACQSVWKRKSEAKAKANRAAAIKTPAPRRSVVAPGSTTPPTVFTVPETPPPAAPASDLIWAGASIAYSRAAILRVEVVEDNGDLLINLVTTALEFDRKAGVMHNATYTHEGAEAGAILAQLGGPARVAGLSDEINTLKAEIAKLRQAQNMKDEQIIGTTHAMDMLQAEVDRLAITARNYDALTARLAAAGITIKLDE